MRTINQPPSTTGAVCAFALACGLAACAEGPEGHALFEGQAASRQQELTQPCSQASSNFSANCIQFGGSQGSCNAPSNGTMTCTCSGGAAEGTYSTKCSGDLPMPE